MIARKQKLIAINRGVEYLLKKGIYPSVLTIFDYIQKKYKGVKWGIPFAKYRPAIPSQPIGGSDGKDIERSFNEVKTDLDLLFNSLIETAEYTIVSQQKFDNKIENMRKRLNSLSQEIDMLSSSFANGALSEYYDTLIDTSKIDLSLSTAEIDTEEGCAILPRKRNATVAYKIKNIKVLNETINKVYGRIENLFSDYKNYTWTALLNGGTYVSEIYLGQEYKSNAIYVEITSPLEITIEYSPDKGVNYYQLVSSKLTTHKTFRFQEMNLEYIKITITGKEVGLRTIQILKSSYDLAASLYTNDIYNLDDSSNKKVIRAIQVRTQTELPKGSSINAFVSTNDGSNWMSISNEPVVITTSDIGYYPLEFNQEYESLDEISLYTSNTIPKDIITGTETIALGRGQVSVDYFNNDWRELDGVDHIPTLEDWNNRLGIRTAFFDTSNISHNAINNSTELSGKETMISEGDVSYLDGSTSYGEWLQIGVKDAFNTPLLASNGNYKFTFYIYSVEPVTLYNRCAFLYNASVNAVAAPFHVYLNTKSIISSKYTTNTYSQIPEHMANYSFVKGWNKLEVLMYYPGTIGVTDGVTIPATGLTVLYLSPNPFSLSYPFSKIQAIQTSNKVSEFKLRNMSLGNKDYWSISNNKVLLNYDPKNIYRILSTESRTAKSMFDGINSSRNLNVELSYWKRNENAIDTIKLRFDLTRDAGTDVTPKLHGYSVEVI